VLTGNETKGSSRVYGLIHPEFLNHLGSEALAWLIDLFVRMIWEQRIPKVRRQLKITALEKPRKQEG